MNRRRFFLAAAASPAAIRAAETKVLLPSDQPDENGFRLMWYNPVPPIDQKTWRLSISGLVEKPAALSVADLRKLPQEEQSSRMKCVQCWSARTTWGGFRFHELVDIVKPNPTAKAARIDCADKWYEYFSMRDLLSARVLLALDMAGQPLADKHGAPLRLIDPSRYGYKSAKLITSIQFVAEGKGSMACDIGPYYSATGEIQAGYDHPLGPRREGPQKNRRRRDHGVLMLALTKRRFLQLAGLSIAPRILPRSLRAAARQPQTARKVVIVTFGGGVRYSETFAPEGVRNIPRLVELKPKGLFFRSCTNAGVLSHYNSTASILTGNWQRVDDFGFQPPSTPTIFEYYRKQTGAGPVDAWAIATNKSFSLIGSGADRDMGQPYGANVVLPKQLLLEAVEGVVKKNSGAGVANRENVLQHLEAILSEGYEGVGWTIFKAGGQLDRSVRETLAHALVEYINGPEAPSSGDELTFFIAREVMREFSPRLMLVNFWDMDVAHWGSYSLYLQAITKTDRLTGMLWEEVQSNPSYKDRTTMLVLPELGRDGDINAANGFLNHRSGDPSCQYVAAGPGGRRRARGNRAAGIPRRSRRHHRRAPRLQGRRDYGPAPARDLELMAADSKLSPAMQALVDKGLFERLPPTFSTFFFEKLQEWETLFPAERSYHERLFALIDRSDATLVEKLFEPLRRIEQVMGVNEKTWPRRHFTLDQVDFLNRSAHYPEWRQAVSDIFARLDPVLEEEIERQGHARLVVVIAPAELPVGPDRMWLRIRQHGKRISLDPPGNVADYLPLLLTGAVRKQGAPSIGARYALAKEPYAAWSIEAGGGLSDLGNAGALVSLSYDKLREYRARLTREVSDILRTQDVRGPRQLLAKLKELKISAAEGDMGRDPVLAEFTRATLLSGNGTLLINNTFVEWSTMQAVRRARPSVTVVSFGIRNKVKPFASVLIFADQETSTPIPTQMDTLGTYVDLEIFHQYIWQEFEKYAEYRRNTAYLFAGEGMDELLAIAPPDFPLLATKQPVQLAQVFGTMKDWMSL